MTERWFLRPGELARDGWESVVDGATPGWQHTGLRVASVGAGERLELPAAGEERIVVPLSGSFSVEVVDEVARRFELTGRSSVFDGPTDVLYLSSAAAAVITGAGRIAVAMSPTDAVHPTRYVPAADTSIELRGAGNSSRQVHNFGTPDALDAERLIVCEVITPSGNWSSYPPHKHDEHLDGTESRLEEIYYFEAAPDGTVADIPDPDAAFGMFSAYSSPAGSIEINARVHSGDIALVPYGYHGPAVAAPGYHLYYLNVMAGPDLERAWLISDDPDHAWVRRTWPELAVDPRLPLTHEKEGQGQ